MGIYLNDFKESYQNEIVSTSKKLVYHVLNFILLYYMESINKNSTNVFLSIKNINNG